MRIIKNLVTFFNSHQRWIAVLFALIIVFILYKTNQLHKNHFEQFSQAFEPISIIRVFSIISVLIILMCFNWFMEALKFKVLYKKEFTIKQLYQSTWVGVASSIIFPNRTGEFVGRNTFLYQQVFHANGIYIGLIASIVQQFVTCVLALIAFAYLAVYYQVAYHQIIVLMSALVSFFLFCLLLIPTKYIKKALPIKLKYQIALSKIDYKQKLKVLLLALLRYFIFSSQIVIAIYLFTGPIFLTDQLACLVAIYFFIISYVPSYFLTDAFVRYGIAISLFTNVLASIAVLLVWIINIMLPACIGSLLLYIKNKKSI